VIKSKDFKGQPPIISSIGILKTRVKEKIFWIDAKRIFNVIIMKKTTSKIFEEKLGK
jgi:hypothetical protein